jgi:putative membrane protein
MRNTLYIGALALLVTASTACNNGRKARNFNEKTGVDDMALSFLKKANEASLTEVKAANVAQSKSKNPKVLSFAKMMISDHMTALKDLDQIEESKRVIRGNDMINAEHTKLIDSIGRLNGGQFDKAYMNMMVEDHTVAVTLFNDITRNTTRSVQQYAKKYLPKLEMHLKSAKELNASL